MDEVKEKYEQALREVDKVLGKYTKRDIETYVKRLERHNLGLTTTCSNLREYKDKQFGNKG